VLYRHSNRRTPNVPSAAALRVAIIV
jgi:hypothetical protein